MQGAGLWSTARTLVGVLVASVDLGERSFIGQLSTPEESASWSGNRVVSASPLVRNRIVILILSSDLATDCGMKFRLCPLISLSGSW
jgi:hypothetical protein